MELCKKPRLKAWIDAIAIDVFAETRLSAVSAIQVELASIGESGHHFALLRRYTPRNPFSFMPSRKMHCIVCAMPNHLRHQEK
jgi:hypothetical protein